MTKYTQFTKELGSAVDLVCSSLYEEMFAKVMQAPETLSSEEEKMLLNSPNCITWYVGEQRASIADRFRRAHIAWFNKWLSDYGMCQPPYFKWNVTRKRTMLHLSNLFFRIDLGDVIQSEDVRTGFQQIAETAKRLLSSISQSNPTVIDQAAFPLVRQLLLILFYFTLDTELALYLKNMQLVELMSVLVRSSNNDDEIQLQVYRILAVIMAEEDIKKLENSNRIATVFIGIISQSMNEGVPSEGRLFNTLRSLKVLVQHEQIRGELIKQNHYTHLVRCALGDQFDPIKAKLPALEILLALTSNEDFLVLLRDNIEFVTFVRTSTEAGLEQVTKALLWKLDTAAVTKKDETISSASASTSAPTKQHDIMISYSHQDRELCHRICSALEKDQFRVWIDSKLMSGATFGAMASAIENAEFVLICMSDAYKQSPFCEMEASYAAQRRCSIVPLVVTPKYKADGWLGILTTLLTRIDFPKLGFDKAFDEMKKQIQLLRIQKAPTTGEQHVQQSTEHSLISHTSTPPTLKVEEPRPVITYPPCIDSWSADQVKSFLLDKDLDALLPALEGMNGQLIHRAFKMCQANEQGMFLSLEKQIAQSHRVTLTLKDYLTFLDAIKIYIPCSDNDQSSVSALCCLS